MFYLTTMMGTMIAISTLSWLSAWIGLEMNLLSVLPLMKTKTKTSTEVMIKYFIVQAIASNILLFSIIIFTNSAYFSLFNTSSSKILPLIISSSLFLKIGAAPFHFWLPEVSSGLPWNMVLILLTWQKLAPMILLTNTINNLNFTYSIIILSSIIGSFLGLNQTCLRKLMAYSSINHMSWMISMLLISYNTWLMYFIIYSIINLNIIIILHKFNLNNMTQMFKFSNFNKNLKLLFMMNFFSLGGLPPFLGFMPKWMAVNQLINNKSYTISILLILTSLISLYFYVRLSFSSLTFFCLENLNKKMFWWKGFLMTLTNLTTLLGLLFFSLSYYLM
uniref:NADH-ubiquinone oxidoreductase chain 2 n=1 Tax=Hylastes attenuatus TaxID=471226 RepID=A0A343A6I4_9CUCU|nr:NADH dehydrogenase subunit 2 [Hylastes attenuatus]AOY40176.1 NADH dehydrogenase subunit 2 [Hylastes attenuatus]